MGQYYKPIILSANNGIVGFWYSHKVGQGLKLMEHSYINNSLCNCVENYLLANAGGRLVWAGDYADPERIKLTKEEAKKVWQAMVADGKTTCSFTTFWKSGNEALYKPKQDGDLNLYSIATGETDENGKVIRRAKPQLPYNTESNDGVRFFVNEDKKQFFDLWAVPFVGGMRVHPLPLLTADGNGRGGGDYSGLDMNLVGSWARDFIRIMPRSDYETGKWLREHYTEIKPDFVETYEIYDEFVRLSRLIEKAMTTDSSTLEHQNNSDFLGAIRYGMDKVKKVLPKKTMVVQKVIDRYTKRYDEAPQTE